MRKRTSSLLAATLAVVTLGVGLQPARAFLDKTRFLFDTGTAFFAFHHWVWNPYKAGDFKSNVPHHTKYIVKAGLATLFAVHQIKSADSIAHKSKSPLLHKIAGAMDKMESSFSTAGAHLKNGVFAAKELDGANGTLLSVGDVAKRAGMVIKDHAIKIPGVG